MAWTTPKTWANGTLTATELNEQIRDNFNSAGTWTPYTPTWASAGTQPALGNGILYADYSRLGDTIHFSVTIQMGSTTTYGTGAYTISLPFAAASGPRQIFSAMYNDSGSDYIGVGMVPSGSSSCYLFTGISTFVTATAPFTFGNGDVIAVSGTYRKA